MAVQDLRGKMASVDCASCWIYMRNAYVHRKHTISSTIARRRACPADPGPPRSYTARTTRCEDGDDRRLDRRLDSKWARDGIPSPSVPQDFESSDDEEQLFIDGLAQGHWAYA